MIRRFLRLCRPFQTSITRERYFWRWNTEEEIPDQHAFVSAYGQRDRQCYRSFSPRWTKRVYRRTRSLCIRRTTATTWRIAVSLENGPIRGVDPGSLDHNRSACCGAGEGKSHRGDGSESRSFSLSTTHWAGTEIPNRYRGKSLKIDYRGASTVELANLDVSRTFCGAESHSCLRGNPKQIDLIPLELF